MYVTKFCRAPSGLWVGVIEYNGGHIFSAGRTLDDLLKRIKNNSYTVTKGQVRNCQVYIDTKQHDTYEFNKLFGVFMSTMFRAKFWNAKDPKKEIEPETYRTYIKRDEDKKPAEQPRVEPTKKSGSDEFVAEKVGDYMVMYRLVEVARFKLHNSTPALEPNTESQE